MNKVHSLLYSARRGRGRGHDGLRLVNCVRAAMSKSVSKPKTFLAAKLSC